MRCTGCPRRCGADREAGETGLCGAGREMRVAKVMLHPFEEPCFGERSGAVFFTGCPLRCVYCQNKPLSRCEIAGEAYSPGQLSEVLLRLQRDGADNIDLISPTQYAEQITEALRTARPQLCVPVIWNTGGYETEETVRAAARYADIFLTDMKYGTQALAEAYSAAADYPDRAIEALKAMVEETGAPVWQGDRLTRGVVVRHLVLPGGRHDSIEALSRIAGAVDPKTVVLSLLRQYTPDFAPAGMRPLNRRVTTFEYESVREAALALGFSGFGQDAASADKVYTPVWGQE